jgi:SET domain-containing protein|tara:strand:+ start:91 stop:534 length:444 start_codon:yes stop_codon:yes gene_type:complete
MKDKLFLSKHLEARKSSIEGRGVFSTEDIKADEKIEESHLILLKNNKWEECDTELRRFVLPWIELREDWKQFCDEHGGIASFHATRPVAVLGFGMIYNHADDNNIDYFVDKNQFLCLFKANRDIAAGSELTINYGEDYFNLSHIEKK